MNVAQYIYSNQKENKKMSNIKTPYRYDFVGSFLRPQALKDAKADFLAGKIRSYTKESLEAFKNEGITIDYALTISGTATTKKSVLPDRFPPPSPEGQRRFPPASWI